MKKQQLTLKEGLEKHLSCGIRVEVHERIDSTNEEAKRLAMGGERDLCLIVAHEQSAGRGRQGHTFYSPAQTGAYFTLLFTSCEDMASVTSLTSGTAVAVMRAIRRVCGLQTGIKWVNDLFLDGRKVCGILAESLPIRGGERAYLIGIGINLSTEAFPEELDGIAGSLSCTTDRRAELIAAAVEELLPMLCDPSDRTWLEDYRTYSTVLGKRIAWEHTGRVYTGVADEIDAEGALKLSTDEGECIRISTGSITLLD